MTEEKVVEVSGKEIKDKISVNLNPFFVGILFIVFVFGLVSGVAIMLEEKSSGNSTEFRLSTEDKNFILAAGFNTNFCEGLGLQRSVYVQKDGNNVFGMPVCIERTDLNKTK